MKASAEGILYPKDAKPSLLMTFHASLDLLNSCTLSSLDSKTIEIPHAAWSKCKDELDMAFERVAGAKASHIFVLGPLHNGPITPESSDAVYAPSDGSLKGSDWEIMLCVPESLKRFVTFSDDICSEEHSLELAAPYLSLLFPKVPVCHLLASGMCENVKKIAFEVKNSFPNAIVFISNNRETCCAGMWKEAFC